MSQHPGIVVGLDDVRGPELDWAAREAENRQLPLQLVRAYHMIRNRCRSTGPSIG